MKTNDSRVLGVGALPRTQWSGKPERDSQRSKVYAAENEAFRAYSPKNSEPTLPRVKDCERFVKKVFASKRVKAAFPRATREIWGVPRIEDGRGCRAARGGYSFLVLPRWARRDWVVLHEIAHTITGREVGDVPAHGWQYCTVYLRLVLYVLGREHHDALKASFKKHRVRFTEPRKRKPLTAEQRAVLAERLATARAAKAAAKAAD